METISSSSLPEFQGLPTSFNLRRTLVHRPGRIAGPQVPALMASSNFATLILLPAQDFIAVIPPDPMNVPKSFFAIALFCGSIPWARAQVTVTENFAGINAAIPDDN